VSYVLFRSACIMDARAIVERAERVGAHVILDTFQAAGTVPINLRDLGADFAVGGVLKWLCGGPGVAYLYVRPDLRPKLQPTLTGWMAHQRPFNFEIGLVDRREDSYRFLNGTPHIPALYACQPGFEIISQVGVERIRARSIRQTERLIEGALARGWRVNTPRKVQERGSSWPVIFWWITAPRRAFACRRTFITAMRKLISRSSRLRRFFLPEPGNDIF